MTATWICPLCRTALLSKQTGTLYCSEEAQNWRSTWQMMACLNTFASGANAEWRLLRVWVETLETLERAAEDLAKPWWELRTVWQLEGTCSDAIISQTYSDRVQKLWNGQLHACTLSITRLYNVIIFSASTKSLGTRLTAHHVTVQHAMRIHIIPLNVIINPIKHTDEKKNVCSILEKSIIIGNDYNLKSTTSSHSLDIVP